MTESANKNPEEAHLIVPVVCSCTGSMTTPSFENFVTSKTASAIAQEMKMEVSAKKRPEAMLTLWQEKEIRRYVERTGAYSIGKPSETFRKHHDDKLHTSFQIRSKSPLDPAPEWVPRTFPV